MPQYPRTVILDHPKLLSLEQQKAEIITEGRAISQKIADIDLEMGKIDVRVQAAEAKVDITDLKAQGDALVKEMEALIKTYTDKIKAIEHQIYDRMKAQTDPKLREDYERLKQTKDELETERNKKYLKAQKIKDRIIPIARRLLSKHLENEYEDYFDIQLKDGVLVGAIFSHLDEWDKKFKERKKKQDESKRGL